jgi:16S rRNA (cytosine967-C5)-methyltransferase
VTAPQRSHHQRPRQATARQRTADPSRRTAYDALRAVDTRDAYANLLVPTLLRDRGLAGRDAALVTELVAGVLRGRGSYDPIIAACAARPVDQIDAGTLEVLRLGAHQLLAMRVPDHAAVSATVDLAADALGPKPVGFVNAVLRKVSAEELPGWMNRLAPDRVSDPIGHLAMVHSHPRWIVTAARDSLGGDLAETEAFLAANNVPARVTLTARPGRCEVSELLDAGADAGCWSPYAAVLPGGDPGKIPAVIEGRAGIQDEGSQLVALALAAAPLTGADRRWLDLAAGPGGKAALLAALGAQRGAHLLAAERQEHRARLVDAVVGYSATVRSATVVVADSTVPAWGEASMDRVLADVPCTGLGALRRRPEARWRRQPPDVAVLGRTQRALLGAALQAARPGGVVAYVTCSPHLGETRLVVNDALRKHSNVQLLDAREVLAGVMTGAAELGGRPDVQLWPHRHGTDALYLALLRRR